MAKRSRHGKKGGDNTRKKSGGTPRGKAKGKAKAKARLDGNVVVATRQGRTRADRQALRALKLEARRNMREAMNAEATAAGHFYGEHGGGGDFGIDFGLNFGDNPFCLVRLRGWR